jgi:hypothetical protein
MASDLSDYLEQALLDHVFRDIPYDAPATIYLAAFTTLPTKAGTGAVEPGGSYARQAIAFERVTGPNRVLNDGGESIPVPASTIVGIGLYDAETGGNLLAFKAKGPYTFSASGNLLLSDNDLSFALAA